MIRFHFIRSSRGTTLFIPPYYNTLFALRMQQAKHRVALGAWETDSRWDLDVWNIVSRIYGLGVVCEACLRDECQEVLSIISTREEHARDVLRTYLEGPRERYTPYRTGPLSTTREIERTPEAPASRSKREAAEILGLGWPVTRGDVTRAYRVAIQRAHPDHPGGSDAEFLRVFSAKEVLLA